jgi:hypothetical protein
MDTSSSNKNPKKGSLTSLSEDPQMDRLAEILEKLPPDRQEAFGEWLEETDDSGEKGSDE